MSLKDILHSAQDILPMTSSHQVYDDERLAMLVYEGLSIASPREKTFHNQMYFTSVEVKKHALQINDKLDAAKELRMRIIEKRESEGKYD